MNYMFDEYVDDFMVFSIVIFLFLKIPLGYHVYLDLDKLKETTNCTWNLQNKCDYVGMPCGDDLHLNLHDVQCFLEFIKFHKNNIT